MDLQIQLCSDGEDLAVILAVVAEAFWPTAGHQRRKGQLASALQFEGAAAAVAH